MYCRENGLDSWIRAQTSRNIYSRAATRSVGFLRNILKFEENMICSKFNINLVQQTLFSDEWKTGFVRILYKLCHVTKYVGLETRDKIISKLGTAAFSRASVRDSP